ncbi:Alanine dehydrogenase [Pseudovibrio axinellae]|uniref:Alanine dehydrogenase n=1 Tax=Pseudovibrio axinellae TaxID=989403 RepID=A0A165U1M1_9HYPH|nr:hypothetical protein [Pseudovibrio axinellae]KZL09443.1 Alanine dehydrogenase [Pseudovibrio axinellae]SEQ64743.1 alanine dehydrogenase [Pseudovibrio axinellae]
MRISVLKEIKPDELRVALRPDQASTLSRDGHEVYVEEGAGLASGFSDQNYLDCGALVRPKAQVIRAGKLLLKVKAPLEEEYEDYDQDKILFTYLHLDENIPAPTIQRFLTSGVMGIAYEWVGGDQHYPLLEPMSRLTGYLFAQKSIELSALNKGVFLPANERFLPGGNVLVIGAGNIGLSAIKYFADLNVNLTVLTKGGAEQLSKKLRDRFGDGAPDPDRFRSLVMSVNQPEQTVQELAALMPELDILLNCAVRRPDMPKEKLEFLVCKEMIAKMAPGSIVCDATACDQDLLETCISSPLLEETSTQMGVVHYNCDHIPARVPATATKLLTDTTFKYVRSIANKGIVEALQEDAYLKNGVVCFQGHITHPYTAEKKGFKYCDLDSLLDT